MELVSRMNFHKVAAHKGCSTSQISTTMFSPAVNKSNQDGDQHDATHKFDYCKEHKKPTRHIQLHSLLFLSQLQGSQRAATFGQH